MTKLILGFILWIFIFLKPLTVSAEAIEEYEQAKLDYINAVVCMATYGDYNGRFARYELSELGWDVSPFKDNVDGTEVKFITVKGQDNRPERNLYIVAITGTESHKDIMLDLNFHKVFFGGTTPEEFVEFAKRDKLTSQDPMVHSGFNKYANAAFYGQDDTGETYGVYLARILKEDSNRKIYLTGHSLGGAAATLQAARLISMGVNPKQIEVVSFGAPAVGNKVFADSYGSRINLRRIVLSGDPVQGALQGISGGYTQFGDKVVWRRHYTLKNFKHEIAVYLDSAMRIYYDKKEKLKNSSLASDVEFLNEKQGKEMVYISAPTLNLDHITIEDKKYVKEILEDVHRWSEHGFIINTEKRGTLNEEIKKAKNAGCKWLVLTNVESKQMQKRYNDFYIAVEDILYNVETEQLEAVFSSARGSNDSTPLGTILNGALQVKQEREALIFNHS